jgi:hypothetical protein
MSVSSPQPALSESAPATPAPGQDMPSFSTSAGEKRTSNQLLYISKNVMKAVWGHEHAWPFRNPVDVVKLNIPVSGKERVEMGGKKIKNLLSLFSGLLCFLTFSHLSHLFLPLKNSQQHYKDVIKRPMDLSTVKKKIARKAYPNAQACIDDLRLIFENCYLFNKPTDPAAPIPVSRNEEHKSTDF